MVAIPHLDPWLAIAVVALGVFLTGFLAAADAALHAISRAKLVQQEKAGSRRAAIALRVLGDRERLSGVFLLARTLVKTATASFAAYAALASFGVSGAACLAIAVALIVVVFGELAPRMAAVAEPERMALKLVRPVARLLALLGPPVRLMQWLARRTLGLFGLRIDSQRPVLAIDEILRDQVELMRQEGTVEKADGDMVSGLLDLKQLEVADVMIHRTKMRTINLDLGPETIVREVLASPYTRMPLWRDKPENIVGVLHAKDLLRALDAAGGDACKLDVATIALETWFVPVNTPLPEQLKAFLARKTHFALAVDEYGEVMGLVTLEDILEEIVGDIRDEHDVAVPGLRQQPDGAVIVDGGVPIRDLNRAMDWQLPDDEATTIAGLVIHEARAIPDAGQAFTFHGFRFEVMRKSRNRLTALRIVPAGNGVPAGPEAATAPVRG